MLTIIATMLAFAGASFLLTTMVGENWPRIAVALRGGVEIQTSEVDAAVSRACSRA